MKKSVFKEKKKLFCLVLIILLLVLLPACGGGGGTSGAASGGSAAASVGGSTLAAGTLSTTLNWNAPVTNVDKSTLKDLAGFKIYYGTSSGKYTQVIKVPLSACDLSAGTCAYQVQGLAAGTYYFAITALDSYNHESDYSNELARTVQ